MVSARLRIELCDRSELQTDYAHLVLDGFNCNVFRIYHLHIDRLRCGYGVESVFICRIGSSGKYMRVLHAKSEKCLDTSENYGCKIFNS